MLKTGILAFLLVFFLAASAQEERHVQYWNFNTIEGSISEKTSLKIDEKIHYTPSGLGLDLKFGDLMIEHKFTDWFELGGGLRFSWSKKEMGWVQEERPMIYSNFSKTVRSFEFTYSNRLEYRKFDKEENYFRQKHKINVDFPSLTNWNTKFYTSVEAYLKLTSEQLHLARWLLGLQAFEMKHLQMKLYYALQKNKEADYWGTVDILGINFKIGLTN